MTTSAAVGTGLVSGPMINPIITNTQQTSNTRPVSNQLIRHSTNEPVSNTVPTIERYVELRREDPTEPYGFNIKGGRDVGCPVYIWRVEQGTLAHGQGLQPGDEILSANGIDFTCINHSEALKVLKSTQLLGLLIRPSSSSSVPRSGGSFRGEFYTWVDCYGTPTSPPKEVDLARSPTRLVDLQIDPGQNLGLMIRGGTEYGLGIYVTGVDPGSVAERGGLKRGDEILQVNSRSFTNITHDKAVATLKSNRKMTLTLAYLGKIPADLTYEPNSTRIPIPNLLQTIITDKNLTTGNASATSVLQMIEEKARTVLTKSEHSRFTFYRLEYGQGFLPVYTFVRILLELLNTSEKYTLLTEVREIIRPEDRASFDELIYKPATATINTNECSTLDDNGLLQSSNTLDPMNSMDSELLIDPDDETNGDLVYLREFNSNNPTGQSQIQQHGNGADLMEHTNNGQLRSTNTGGGHDSGLIMDSNNIPTITGPGGNSLGIHHGGSNNAGHNKNSNQGLVPSNNPNSTTSSAIRFRVRCAKTKPLLGIGIEGGSNTTHRLPRIININPDGCAITSNLKAGHVLLSVDGKKLDGLTHEEAVRVITDCFNSESKSSLDFVVVENRNNLIVVSGSGVGIGNSSGSGG